jgi:hypothetical protein
MKYRHALFAALLASAGFSAAAQDADVMVKPNEACPPRTALSVPAYSWKDGRFVLDGWLCQSLDKSKN